MPEDRERVAIGRVAGGQDLDSLALPKRKPEVLDAPVRAHEHGLLGEARADRGGGVQAGRTLGEFEFRVVG